VTNYKVVLYDIAYNAAHFQPNRAELDFPIELVDMIFENIFTGED
jgi:hypothetical protein